MNYMKILLIYMAAAMSMAVQSTTAPVVTPEPTPTAVVTVAGQTPAPESAKVTSRSFAIDAPRAVEREIRNTPFEAGTESHASSASCRHSTESLPVWTGARPDSRTDCVPAAFTATTA